MSTILKKERFLQRFQSFHNYKILKMYGILNEMNLKRENRYILCNFIDQNSIKFKTDGDIYEKNNEYSLNHLFIFAINKAKQHDLMQTLYEEYTNSINAIIQKREIKSF
ncbi:MAG: hypothetical protein ACTSV5_04810 [Promethearchaeota archaeon]